MSRLRVRAHGVRVRLAELAVNASLAVSTVTGHLADDPLLLVVQTSRRLPRPVVVRLATVLVGRRRRAGLRSSYGAWLMGRSDVAAAALAAAVHDAAAHGPARLRRRLLSELAVQLGRPDLGGPLDGAAPSLRARAAWLRGDVPEVTRPTRPRTRATPLEARLASEVRLLQPGRRLTPPTSPTPVGARRGRAGGRGTGDGRPSAPSDRISIFHVLTNSVPHTQSGYALRSHSVLRAQRDAGLRVAAATRLAYPVSIGTVTARHRDVVDGISYHRVIPARMGRTAEQRAQQQADLLLPLLLRWAPDLLHTTTNYSNALVTQALAASLGVPWVYEVRGLLEETWVASHPPGAEQERAARSERYSLLRAKETEMARAADQVVTLSMTLRRELISRGVESSRISVVPNAVDVALLGAACAAPDARRALGLPGEGFWVGTVSSLVDYEGLDTLIDAVSELRARGVDARALIVGDGVSRVMLEHRAAVTGLGRHAVFTGRVDAHHAASYHRALDVFVVPRRDVEVSRRVTPLKPTEAMAVGRPVVVSDLPALLELVEPHGSGSAFPAGDAVALADALEALHSSPELRARHAAAGRAFAATRTWPAAAAAYGTVYRDLVAGRPA